ncbi:MAG: PAS domain-containing protein [Phycisphaerales bacterium]|nr:PAS domain-containing protein [Phycisphaerales bacterium]MCB9862687.1 PAS domain-containing protein [Phycisphaerales bacterium]
MTRKTLRQGNHMGAGQSTEQNASVAPMIAAQAASDAVLDALPIGLVVFDTKLRIRSANTVARSIVQSDHEAPAFLRRLCEDGPFVDWSSELQDVWRRRMTRRFEAVAGNERGAPDRFFDICIRPLNDASTSDAAGVILIDDVTARISMQRRLAISERMAAIGKVAARVAHELNNPLDGILRYSNLASRRLEAGSRQKITEYLDRIREGSLRMSGIVRDLLEFSRSHTDVDREATLNGIVADAIDAMRDRAAQHHVALRHEAATNDARVDKGTGLFQVFCNLIKNAIDAMEQGGSLTVLTQTGDPEHCVIFEDTGPGVPDPQRIFEAFYTTKASGKGTGLGLAVCREIVESLGGSIAAENRAEGGARFCVRLPRVDREHRKENSNE